MRLKTVGNSGPSAQSKSMFLCYNNDQKEAIINRGLVNVLNHPSFQILKNIFHLVPSQQRTSKRCAGRDCSNATALCHSMDAMMAFSEMTSGCRANRGSLGGGASHTSCARWLTMVDTSKITAIAASSLRVCWLASMPMLEPARGVFPLLA